MKGILGVMEEVKPEMLLTLTGGSKKYASVLSSIGKSVVMRYAAKKAVLGKKKQLAIVKKYRENVIKNENANKRSISKFSKRMEKFLDGADRQWLLDRELRSMEVSYRGSSERLRDSRFLLSMASRKIGEIRDRIIKPITQI